MGAMQPFMPDLSKMTIGPAMTKGGVVMQQFTRVETVTVPQHVPADPQWLYVAIVLDCSGSMAGSKISAAKDGIREIFSDMKPKEQLAFVVFDSSVTTRFEFTPKKDIRIDEQLAAVDTGSSTALWDATLAAMHAFDKQKSRTDAHRYLIVLTDGEDNASSPGSFETLQDKLKKPGYAKFHACFLAVGDAAAAGGSLKRLCAGIKHCDVIDVADSGEAITREMKKASKMVTTRTTITQVVQVVKHSPPPKKKH